MTATEPLSSFVADLTYTDLPEDVRSRAGLVLADTIGAIIGGSTTQPVRSLQEVYADQYTGPSTVLGTDSSVPILRAALLNGIAGTVLELDEGHKQAAGHPAIHVLPPLLAFAEADGGDGKSFITAFVAGYEAAVRVAQATNPLAEGYHPHGVWGVIGAAAALANYTKMDTQSVTTALDIAANHAQHTRFEAALEGATVRDTYAGMSGPDAILAVDQARSGFTGLKQGVARHLEGASKNGFGTIPTESLGDQWELTEGYFKLHAACRYTHPALDAIDELTSRYSVDAESITEVSVETYLAAASLDDPEPQTRLGAKFSIPFALASRIVHRHSGKEAFEPDALRPEVYELARRISVESTAAFTAAAPDARSARVTVKTSETCYSTTIEQARGGAERPFNKRQLREKFQSLVEPALGTAKAEKAWSTAVDVSAIDIPMMCDITRRA